MALNRYNSGKTYQLNDKQIRQEIFRLLGLSPNNEEDKRVYKRRYDVLRQRVSNYNILTQPTNPVRTNEIMLKILRNQSIGNELTNQQQAILNTPAVSSGKFRRQYLSGDGKLRNNAIQITEFQFKGLLTASPTARRQYQNWMNELINIYTDLETGEIISAKQANSLPANQVQVDLVYRSERVEVQEINQFLSKLALDIRHKREKIYAKNKAGYEYDIKNVEYD